MNFKVGDKVKVVRKDWKDAIETLVPENYFKEFYGIVVKTPNKTNGVRFCVIDFFYGVNIQFLSGICMEQQFLELVPLIDYSLLQEIEE